MGRKPTRNLNLPTRMRARVRNGTTYYFYDAGGKPRKEIALGTDYVLAVRKWGELHQATPTVQITLAWVAAKYLASPQFEDVGFGTQDDYRYAIDGLLKSFADAPMDGIKPSHVQLHLDRRTAGDKDAGVKASRHRALREKAVLSMLFAWAQARDFCTNNPVAAIKTKRLPGRKNVYIEDDMLESVYKHASPALRDAIDLAFYTGQRPGDVLQMSETDIRDGVLTFGQDKTGRPMRIAVQGDLAKLVDRMLERKRKFAVRPLQLLVDELGKPMTKPKLRTRFEAAREKAGIDGAAFQFRDLRRKAAADLRDQVNIEASQQLLGHSSVTMTEHYAGGKARKVTAMPKKGN